MTDSDSLGVRGAALWAAITGDHDLDAAQLELLREACRCADRLEALNEVIAERPMTVDAVMSEARQQATVFKQLLAALRLPDVASGVRPQQRGGARGAYKPSGAKVSSLDRARARSAG